MSQLKFDQLQVGDALPPLTLAPVNRTTLALFAGASNDHNAIHIDIDFARKAGMPDVFAHGMLSMAYLGRLLTNWVPQEAIREFSVRFAAITQVGDAISCNGVVTEKDEAARTVRVMLTTRDRAGEIKLSGEALIALDA
ncbi:MAG: MaoC family dehydratase [Paraburkholderia sp.]|jgi:acyl dehydratase|nr:MaoC family dehydratase [Paraburkholderia sp.]